MSIIDGDSVLILGAGASAPFGLSLGGNLIDKIIQQLSKEVSPKKTPAFNVKYSEKHQREAFSLKPIQCAYHEQFGNSDGYGDAAESLIELLRRSTHDTIDDFMVDNPRHGPLCKIAIANALFQQIYSKVDNPNDGLTSGYSNASMNLVRHYHIRDFCGRALGNYRNWTHILINMVRFSVRNKLGAGKVRIVTFNYDTVLEYILSKIFQSTELEYQDFREHFDIAHMHGEFSELEEIVESPAKTVVDWANGICVVQEDSANVPDQVRTNRKLAKDWVHSSRKMYAAGFAFAGANCRLIGLNRLTKTGNELFYCNYDGNMGLKQAVKRITGTSQGRRHPSDIFQNVECAEGSFDRPVGIQDWFAAGYAGETPA